MVALKQPKYITPQAYLEWEEKAETKSEYHDGVIVAMAGASPEHNAITFNVIGELNPQLRRGNCRGFSSDLRVRLPACNTYFYPDVSVACEEPRYDIIRGLRALLNPTMIVEVLSDSTERDDRGSKFRCYQTVDSLQAYVLVAQDRPRIEIYTRQEEGSWRYLAFEGLEAVVELPFIDCELRLAHVYARITFPPLSDTVSDAAQRESTE